MKAKNTVFVTLDYNVSGNNIVGTTNNRMGRAAYIIKTAHKKGLSTLVAYETDETGKTTRYNYTGELIKYYKEHQNKPIRILHG